MLLQERNVLFPNVAYEDFDFEEGWAVAGFDPEGKNIKFQGLNRNKDLEFIVHYANDIATFKEKVAYYTEIKMVIQADIQRKYRAGEISREEAIQPIHVLEYFPRRYFLENGDDEELVELWEEIE